MKRILIAVLLVAVVVCFAGGRFIKTKEVSVNPYTSTSVVESAVEGVNVYSADVNYKISFDGTNYITLPKGTAINVNNLNIISFKMYLQGATETDTGKVSVILIQK